MTLLMDSALKATVILALAWVAALLLRRASADLRHRVWLAAILAVAALPGLLWVVPKIWPSQAWIAIPAGLQLSSAATPVQQGFVAAAVWAAGTVLLLLRLAFAALKVAGWTRRARRGDDALYSEHTETPIAWGVLRPVVILPSYAASWPTEKRRMVIRHELAHIERRDWLWQMAANLVTAMFWFHPLVWLAAAGLRREAERATDDRVLAAGTTPSDYAAQLLEVARRLRQGVPVAAVAMVRRPALESRVREILDSSRSRRRAGTLARFVILLTAVALTFSFAMAQSRVHKIGEKDMTPPKVLAKTEPGYTPEARDAKIQGKVVVKVEIDERGKAQNIRVTKSIDRGLDAKAVEAISQWSFDPARKKGKPVRCAATIEVNFRLL